MIGLKLAATFHSASKRREEHSNLLFILGSTAQTQNDMLRITSFLMFPLGKVKKNNAKIIIILRL